MSKGYVAVEGAKCKCKFGNAPDSLVVQSQQKSFINDEAGSKKKIANTMDIGVPFQAKTFGQCKLQPTLAGFLPCIPSVTQWQDPYDKVELANGGQILTKNSKATCAIAGAPCIELTTHGQTIEVNSNNIEESDEQVLSVLNPIVNLKRMTNSSSDIEAWIINNNTNQNPQILNGCWLTKNKEILKQENGLNNTVAYGESVRIRIKTQDVADGNFATITIKGSPISKSNIGFKPFSIRCKIHNNVGTTEPIFINPLWYNEEIENYDYKNHKTIIDTNKTLSLTFDVRLAGKLATNLPLEANKSLKPITYRRNYEELIGLFKKGTTIKEKDIKDNYENHFIKSNTEIETIVTNFIKNCTKPNTTIEYIKNLVNKDATKLWKAAVKQVQNGNLDDRPLYWARNKMQAYLKRNPLFKNQFNIETSIIKANSELADIITIFEEKSRNYTGIDFSKAGNKKKILITGFDPFVLDPTKDGNPLQSNPSGVNALAIHENNIGNYYVQTLICPVRYADFDIFKEKKGIIEYFIEPFINKNKVDMIITVSQGGVFRFDIDRFPCKNRGGSSDNMYWGNKADGYNNKFKQLTIKGEEFYETKLPYEKIVPLKNKKTDLFRIYFNQTFSTINDSFINENLDGFEKIENISDGTPNNNCLLNNLEKMKSTKSNSGSGSNYLSNEIFYRVARLRSNINPTLPTGHLHIPLIQDNNLLKAYKKANKSKKSLLRKKYHNIDKVTRDINPLMSELLLTINKIIENV